MKSRLFTSRKLTLKSLVGFIIAVAFVFTQLAIVSPSLKAQEKEQNLAYADLLFSQGEYFKAARQYRLFIEQNRDSPNIQSGWFRLGECYLQVKQVDDAVVSFKVLVDNYNGGTYVGSAAYRLGVLAFNDSKFTESAKYFDVASRELSSPEAKHQARYYYARSLQFTKDYDKSLALYEDVLKSDTDPKTNPFYEKSKLESARIYIEKGDKENAYKQFISLSQTAVTQAVKEEAITRGGMIASELGKTRESEALLSQSFNFPSTSPWKPVALVGSIFNAFVKKDYDRVISIYGTGALTNVPDEYRAKMLLIVGHSYRLKGDTRSSSRLYDLVEARYPGSNEAMSAGYRKLQILYQQSSGSLPSTVKRYIVTLKRQNPKDPNIDMANLMLAEYHFTQADRSIQQGNVDLAKSNYKSAAAAYSEVRAENIREKDRPTRLYKQGWAYLESGDLQKGMLALSRFIKRYPENTFTPSALAKRGFVYQSVEDFTFALADYEAIIEDYPRSKELEWSMQQKAFVYGQKRDLPKMIDAFQKLLKRFPNTVAKPEATFWIGVGHYDLDEYRKAIPALEAAKSWDPSFTNRATIRIILAHYSLENVAELTSMAKAYMQSGTTSFNDKDKLDVKYPVPRPVLEFIGKRLAKDEQWADSEYFLTQYSTPSKPAETDVATWKILATSRMSLAKFEQSVQAWDFYLAQVTEEGIDRGYGLLQKGKALFELGKHENSKACVEECLRFVKQGKVNAEAMILFGDNLTAQGDFENAAKKYIFVSQVHEDKDLTPLSLEKLIKSYSTMGDEENVQKFDGELRARYPDFWQAIRGGASEVSPVSPF